MRNSAIPRPGRLHAPFQVLGPERAWFGIQFTSRFNLFPHVPEEYSPNLLLPAGLETEGTADTSRAIRTAKAILEAGAPLVMIESEGITESVRSWRTDVAAKIADEAGLDKVMFEDDFVSGRTPTPLSVP